MERGGGGVRGEGKGDREGWTGGARRGKEGTERECRGRGGS